MNSTLKLWTQLGLGTALAGGLLAACGGEAGGEGATGEAGGESAAVAGEGEGGVQLGELFGTQRFRHAFQETHPLLRAPAGGVEPGRGGLAGQPLGLRAVDGVEAGRHIGRQAVGVVRPQPGAVVGRAAQGVQQQHLGVQPVQALLLGLYQSISEVLPGVHRLFRCSSSASSSVPRATCRAWITSPRSPSITCSSL